MPGAKQKLPLSLCAALLAMQGTAGAEQLPLWEIGAGGGFLTAPDYRGSNQTHSYAVPLLMPFYRGKILRADESGIRGELFKTERTRLDLSFDGSVPVDSEKNQARSGMPDLDATVQIGPALNIKLWQDNSARQALIGYLPVRAAFAVSPSSFDKLGYTFTPQLWYHRKVGFIDGDWQLGLSAGVEYGSDAFHDYYYRVAPQYQTAQRKAFDASSGYGGYRSNFTFYRRFNNGWASLFARYDNISHASFADSPLITQQKGFTVGLIATWFVAQSHTRVKAEDWRYRGNF